MSPRKLCMKTKHSCRGGAYTEFLVIGLVLVAILFTPLPGEGKDLFHMLIDALKKMYEAFSYTLSLS